MKQGRIFAAVAAAGMLAFFAGAAKAQVQSRVIAVGGEVVMTLRSLDADALKKRGDTVEDRLRYILGDASLEPTDVRVVKSGKDYTIMAGKRLLITVTAEDAKINMTTVPLLAEKWAGNLAGILPKLGAKKP
jgi:hypothetical protein